MKKIILISTILIASVVAWTVFANSPVADSAKVGEKAPDFSLVDSYGKSHSLSDFSGKFVVLEWLNHDCPFVRKFYNAGKMQELQKMYTGKDVVWLSVISSKEGAQGHMTPEQINKAVQDKGSHATAVLIDEPGTVGRMYDARTTPHMFVINPDGILLYDGAIDNKSTANPADLEGAENYVVAALDAAMDGKEVAVKTTRPYGCSVKY